MATKTTCDFCQQSIQSNEQRNSLDTSRKTGTANPQGRRFDTCDFCDAQLDTQLPVFVQAVATASLAARAAAQAPSP